MQNITNPETARIGRVKVANQELVKNDVHFTIIDAGETIEGDFYPLDCCQFV